MSGEEEAIQERSRGYWHSRWEYLLSLASFCIGVGNVWRFPYLCYKNGGGAFLVPYLIMVLVLGVPLFLLESAMGQFASSGCITVFNAAPLLKGTGYAMIIVSLIGSFYYTMVIAYPLIFIYNSMTSKLPWTSCDNPWNTEHCFSLSDATSQLNSSYEEDYHTDPFFSTGVNKRVSPADEFFHNVVLRVSSGLGESEMVWPLVLASFIVYLVVFLVTFMGVKVIGKVVWVTTLFPYVMLIVLFIRGVTLPGASYGILYYVYPDVKELVNPRVWWEAGVQVMFSLGPGMGVLMALGSYNRYHHPIIQDAFVMPFVNSATSVFAGFVVFSVLGFLSQQMNMPLQDVVASGPALAFITYPQALAMLPMAPLWSILFFLMLFFLGVDSAFMMTEAVVVSLVDVIPSFRPRRMVVSFVICCVLFLGSLSCCGTDGIYVVTLLDQYSISYTVTLTTFCTVITFSHVYGVGRVMRDLKTMMRRPVSFFFYYSWLFITPAIFMISFFVSLILSDGGELRHGDYIFPPWANGVGWISCLFSILAIPIYPIINVLMGKGTMSQRLKGLVNPMDSWGPSLERDRAEWTEMCAAQPLPHRYYHPDADCSSQRSKLRVNPPASPPTATVEEIPLNKPEVV
ncbi:hypothetical protein Pmani_038053 [Petrolisthes manimaculis]|uniref:Transporter n=1 Tax=Petrolisthes manimaculis TaxID=1843537 RepID=A0AAE1TKW2_9EUCA|nr:hypothetical protein Pmani_038053 [Petrolisthes manimaculis]